MKGCQKHFVYPVEFQHTLSVSVDVVEMTKYSQDWEIGELG
jgi:hypothetical protein